jgi:toxin ParE1/3/4
MRQVRLSRSAESDIDAILAWSAENFGEAARLRYAALIAAGIRDIAADPQRAGAKARPELGDGVCSWHLRLSRGRAAAGPVREPRHFLIYRFDEERVTIGRVLHDAMELGRHIDPKTTWE